MFTLNSIRANRRRVQRSHRKKKCQHGLVAHTVNGKGWRCDGACDKGSLPAGTKLYGCRLCNYDLCEECNATNERNKVARCVEINSKKFQNPACQRCQSALVVYPTLDEFVADHPGCECFAPPPNWRCDRCRKINRGCQASCEMCDKERPEYVRTRESPPCGLCDSYLSPECTVYHCPKSDCQWKSCTDCIEDKFSFESQANRQDWVALLMDCFPEFSETLINDIVSFSNVPWVTFDAHVYNFRGGPPPGRGNWLTSTEEKRGRSSRTVGSFFRGDCRLYLCNGTPPRQFGYDMDQFKSVQESVTLADAFLNKPNLCLCVLITFHGCD